MADYNLVVLIGHLTRDPELKYTQGNIPFCNASIAVNKKYKKKDNTEVKEVSFFDLVFWNHTAEIVANHTKKGEAIMVEGELKQQTWDDKQTGQKRSRVVVNCMKFVFMNNQKSDQPNQQRPAAQSVNGRTTQQNQPAPSNDFPDFPDDGPVGEDGAPF